MTNMVYRIMIMPNAGYGNINQLKLFPVKIPNEYDLFVTNANNDNMNFILFARHKSSDDSQMTMNDIFNIVDFIYSLSMKVYQPTHDDVKYTIEIDIASESLKKFIVDRKLLDVNSMESLFNSPGRLNFTRMLLSHIERTNSIPNFEFLLRNYNQEECKRYFFNQCKQCNDNCIKSKNK